MSSITLEDVLEFVVTASVEQMEEIETALDDANHVFYCSECDDRQHSDCDSPEEVSTLAKKELLQQIIRAGNQFGLDDMLNELRREGESHGVYLNQGVVA